MPKHLKEPEDWYGYKMPEVVKAEFKAHILKCFLKELIDVFDIKHEVTMCNTIAHLEGTYGWYEAFKKMCVNYGLEDILAYYDKLEWYDSDLFDGELGDLLVEYGLVEFGNPDDLGYAKIDE